MGNTPKGFSLLLVVILAVTSLIWVESAFAQNPTASPVPIPTPSVPLFTLSFSNQYNALIITVKNQPYDTAYGSMYYNVRLKNHDGDYWYYPLDQLFNAYHNYPEQLTDSDYTNISITVQSNFLLLDAQNDIQVESMLGNIGRDGRYTPAPWVFTGQTSAWSNTQTITVPASSTSASPSPTPTIPEFPSLTIPLLLSMVLAAAGLLVYHKKRS